MEFKTARRLICLIILILIVPAMTGMGCTPTDIPIGSPTPPPLPSPTPHVETMLTFRVQLPSPLPSGDSLYFTLLDEVTGLGFNQQSYVMEAIDPQNYLLILPFHLHTVLKYRYTRRGTNTYQEYHSDGQPVRYRLYHVEGPAFIHDSVSRWADTTFTGQTGRINGQVTDAQTRTPLPNILITAGGAHALTAHDGSFIIEGLTPGIHNVVAYSLDGAYRIYQQGALVAAESATPAVLQLMPARFVKVDIVVSLPPGSVESAPLRMAGNLYQFGNTFADLSGGVNAIASRMPTLIPLGDGRYYISLQLPAGYDFRYKYTLGDGLWNAEATSQGDLRLRHFIVPEEDTFFEERIEAWSSGKTAPITFEITVPDTTPPNEFISIQFHPGFEWTEPIPMWPQGDNRWKYVLYGPLDTLGAIQFRYCRADQCNSADDVRTAGLDAMGLAVSTSVTAVNVNETINSWQWLTRLTDPTTLPNVKVQARGSYFLAGVEFQPYYHPSWLQRMPAAASDVKDMNASWVILTPTWTFTRSQPPMIEPVPGRDPLWPELVSSVHAAQHEGLQVAIFPTPRFPSGPDIWWEEASLDFPFWVTWFDRYRTFILHHAGLAAQTNAAAFVIGGEWVLPALPEDPTGFGVSYNAPGDTEERWRELIADLKLIYKGPLMWALPYPHGVENPPPFLDEVQAIYVLWSEKFVGMGNLSEEIIAIEAGRMLDEDISPIQQKTGKPVVLGLSYPSVEGWLSGCDPAEQEICPGLIDLAQPRPNLELVVLDLEEQVRAYNAMFLALNERDWIRGLVSRDYYPPVELQDKSASVHGKPARSVLWYWFPRLTGTVTP
jgi:hypothetical protein